MTAPGPGEPRGRNQPDSRRSARPGAQGQIMSEAQLEAARPGGSHRRGSSCSRPAADQGRGWPARRGTQRGQPGGWGSPGPVEGDGCLRATGGAGPPVRDMGPDERAGCAGTRACTAPGRPRSLAALPPVSCRSCGRGLRGGCDGPGLGPDPMLAAWITRLPCGFSPALRAAGQCRCLAAPEPAVPEPDPCGAPAAKNPSCGP